MGKKRNDKLSMICSIIQALKKSSAKNKCERKEMTNYLWFVLLFKHLKKVQPKISGKEKKWQIIYDLFYYSST